VGFGPVGLAIVVVAEATQEGEEAGLGPAKVIDRIGAAAAEIADGFVNGVGNVDGDEVVGAEVFDELHRVALVGFDPVTGFDGDERGRDDFTPDSHLEESTGDPEPTAAGFVANVEVGELALLFFGNASHRSFESMLGRGNRSVVARFGVAITFENRDLSRRSLGEGG